MRKRYVSATAGWTVYGIVVNKTTGQVFSSSGTNPADFVAANWDSYGISLTRLNNASGSPIFVFTSLGDIDDDVTYSLFVYRQLGGDRAIGDTLLATLDLGPDLNGLAKRAFNKTVRNANNGTIITYDDDDVTPLFTQTFTDVGGVQTVNKAT